MLAEVGARIIRKARAEAAVRVPSLSAWVCRGGRPRSFVERPGGTASC